MVSRILIGLAVGVLALGGAASDAKPRAPTVIVVQPDGELHRVPSNDKRCSTCDGVALIAAGQYARAMHVFTLQAAKGDGQAMAELGSMYASGLGVPRNLALAQKWFSNAVDSGDPDGAAMVGMIYQHGSGVPQDYRRAITYYRRGVAEHSGLAANQMGYVYEHGLGVKQDLKVASCWYTLAVVNGNPRSAEHLGELEAAGQAVTPDDAAICQAINRGDALTENDPGLGGAVTTH
jgi:TPR repeat protein